MYFLGQTLHQTPLSSLFLEFKPNTLAEVKQLRDGFANFEMLIV
jgi:hypothetical protein